MKGAFTMNQSANPSPFPLSLWSLATALSLADLILRLTEDHVVTEILVVPIILTVLFSAITAVYLRRYLRELKATRSATKPSESPDNQ